MDKCVSLVISIAALPNASNALDEVLDELTSISEYYSQKTSNHLSSTRKVIGSFQNRLGVTVKQKNIPFERLYNDK